MTTKIITDWTSDCCLKILLFCLLNFHIWFSSNILYDTRGLRKQKQHFRVLNLTIYVVWIYHYFTIKCNYIETILSTFGLKAKHRDCHRNAQLQSVYGAINQCKQPLKIPTRCPDLWPASSLPDLLLLWQTSSCFCGWIWNNTIQYTEWGASKTGYRVVLCSSMLVDVWFSFVCCSAKSLTHKRKLSQKSGSYPAGTNHIFPLISFKINIQLSWYSCPCRPGMDDFFCRDFIYLF